VGQQRWVIGDRSNQGTMWNTGVLIFRPRERVGNSDSLGVSWVAEVGGMVETKLVVKFNGSKEHCFPPSHR